jgi:hypothetical protein
VLESLCLIWEWWARIPDAYCYEWGVGLFRGSAPEEGSVSCIAYACWSISDT